MGNRNKRIHFLMWLIMLLIPFVACASGVDSGPIPDPPATPPWYIDFIRNVLVNFPDINGWFMAAMLFIMGVLRALAEFLKFIADKAGSKDSEFAHQIGKVLSWISAIAAWFGVGTIKKK